MLNKRKALIGWLVYTAAKPMVKRKARQAAPGKRGGAIAGAIAALGALAGALMFWRRRKSDEGSAAS